MQVPTSATPSETYDTGTSPPPTADTSPGTENPEIDMLVASPPPPSSNEVQYIYLGLPGQAGALFLTSSVLAFFSAFHALMTLPIAFSSLGLVMVFLLAFSALGIRLSQGYVMKYAPSTYMATDAFTAAFTAEF